MCGCCYDMFLCINVYTNISHVCDVCTGVYVHVYIGVCVCVCMCVCVCVCVYTGSSKLNSKQLSAFTDDQDSFGLV